MDKLCLYGASGHGKVIKDIAESKGKEIVCFFDDQPKSEYLHDTVVKSTKELSEYLNYPMVISIGSNEIRKKIAQQLKVTFTKLIAKSAVLSNRVHIGSGTVVMPRVVVNSDSTIGEHCILNSGSVIEHDCKLGDFVHVSPGAMITGGVNIDEGTHIGAGAVVIPGITIGKWCTIGAGAVVIRDIPDYSVAVGNPASVIKNKKERNER